MAENKQRNDDLTVDSIADDAIGDSATGGIADKGGIADNAASSSGFQGHSDPELFDKVVNLAKRRGFVFQSAAIYGGFRSAYDYGPLGVLLLRNVKEQWWRSMVQLRHDVV
ncbi:MAG: hypothetical protein OXI96_07370, partial [Acidimicrobiaceae bacterium]|nr:hypothetical protein [Acidimicrobiaceae bacterium]